MISILVILTSFFFQAEDGIRDVAVTGVQTCALPICFPYGIGSASSKCEVSMKLTGAEILCEVLTRLGVREIFGYPGGATPPVYDALGKSKLHHILLRHEQLRLDRKSTRLNSSHGYIPYA